MKALLLRVLAIVAACPLSSSPSFASDDTIEAEMLVVGTKESPPFSFKNSDGEWTGLSIEMWRRVADELDLKYEFREEPLDSLLAGVQSGEIDVVVAALSVTAERNERMDFCHPHFTTGLGIAASTDQHASLMSLAKRVFRPQLLLTGGAIVGVLLLSGVLFWLIERRHNEGAFGGSRRQGIEMGVWWSTILLLGHKGVVPASTTGRVVAAIAMVASILLASLLTGVIASVLTLQQLDAGINHPSDLRNLRVATVDSSAALDYLQTRRIAHQTHPTADAAMNALAQDKADAVVYDQALLKYLVNSKYATTAAVLPISFNQQDYAVALKLNSQLRQPLNTALLRFHDSDEWDDLVFRYLGE